MIIEFPARPEPTFTCWVCGKTTPDYERLYTHKPRGARLRDYNFYGAACWDCCDKLDRGEIGLFDPTWSQK